MTVDAGEVGYVRNVDVDALAKVAEEEGLQVWVVRSPGGFVNARGALLKVVGDRAVPSDLVHRLRRAFDVGGARSFDQDPRFGFIVLGEIASRALSPGINDPGTAVDIVGTSVRLLTAWRRAVETRPAPPPNPRVRLQPISYADLLDDVFRPIATDGASSLTVAMRLQKGLAALRADAEGRPDMVEALDAAARTALVRSEAALDFEPDKVRLRAMIKLETTRSDAERQGSEPDGLVVAPIAGDHR